MCTCTSTPRVLTQTERRTAGHSLPLSPSLTLTHQTLSLSLSSSPSLSRSHILRVIGVALGALMRNSMLVSAVSAAAQQMRDKKGQDISSVGELVKAADYRLESVKLENPGFWGGGARCRLLMRATAVTGGGEGAATGVGTGATDAAALEQLYLIY